MNEKRFPIRVDDSARLVLRLFLGATADRAWVTIDQDHVVARLGRWKVSTPTANIVRWRIEGPWRWITAIGVRRSLREGDVSFSGTTRGGVRLELREPLKWMIFDVTVLYVGVEDLQGFASALSELGIDGEDAWGR